MAQPCDHQTKNILLIHPLGISSHQVSAKLSCQEAHPDGVLEAIVGGIGEDQVTSAALFEVPEPLELLGVDNCDRGRRKFNLAVDAERVSNERKRILGRGRGILGEGLRSHESREIILKSISLP